jgi:ABC-type dipeptide/oligopeptide/nickel transport system permease subunit
LAAVFGPLLTPDAYAQNLMEALRGPSAGHWLGTDQLGRDLLARIVVGSRISLTIGLVATVFGIVVGSAIGALSGYFGGLFDTIVTRFMDTLIVFPGILVALMVVTVAGDGLFNVILAVGLRAVPVFARLVHNSTLAIREREYIVAARAAGASGLRILWTHIRPALMNSIIVLAALEVAHSILVAATLSFLGVGISPETAEWGAMLNSGRTYIFRQGQLVVFPGLAIMLAVLSINLFADGLRTVLDPRRSKGAHLS